MYDFQQYNLKQQDLLVILFLLVKLIWMKLRWMKDESSLLKNIGKFNNKSKPKTKEGNDKNRNTLDGVNTFYKGRELYLKAFRSGVFLVEKQGKGLKMLSPKQMLKRLSIALAQVKVGNTSENLLNNIRQIIHSLHREKEITKKVYDSIIIQ